MQVTIELPDQLSDLPRAERDLLIRAGLRAAMIARQREIQGAMDAALVEIRRFEQQYGGVSFEQFETDLLPTLDSSHAHEDYNDWFFWQTVFSEQQTLLNCHIPAS